MNPLSGVFGEAWELYKAHWRHFFSIAIIVFVVLAALGILLTFLLGWFGVIISALITIAGTFWLQGALIQAVSDVRDGRADLSVSQTFERRLPEARDDHRHRPSPRHRDRHRIPAANRARALS